MKAPIARRIRGLPAIRGIVIVAVSICLGASVGASGSPIAGYVPLATAPIIDLDFLNTSGPTVPDRSGNANDGAGRKGDIGAETSWSPTTTRDSQGNAAVVVDGTQKQRIEIPNRSGSLDVNSFSILVQFTLDQSVDTDPVSQRYELMEKAGSFWMNIREDTNPKYVLRVGGYFNGVAHSLTGIHAIPNKILTWAIGTYDGANLKTYVANGDGSNLVLDNSGPRTGTVATGATITGIDENLVVAAKHRMGHFVDGTGGENLEGMYNGTLSRFIVFDTALTQAEIASVITGSAPVGKPGALAGQFLQGSTIGSGANATVPYRVSWAQGTCPARSTYSVKLTTGGSTTEVAHGITALTARVNLMSGPAYTIAVNCNGGGSSTMTLTVAGYQEGAASYTGAWRSTSLAGAWGGTARWTSAKSASASFHCASCRELAWVTDEDSVHGSARVYVDGVLASTVSTRSTAPLDRVVAYKAEWATNGAHTLKIVNLATSGHPRISIDGFLTRK